MKQKLYFDSKYLATELCNMLKPKYLFNDLLAGIIVALVAIPLSLAVAMASGVPAEVGLISAIIGSIVAAFFGGTTLAITGPAIAMTVLISQCVQKYGLSSLIVMGLICGVLQIVFGVLRFGRFTKLIPSPVVSAFIAAIGFIIFFGQLPKAFELSSPEQQNIYYVFHHLGIYADHLNSAVFMIALLTIILVALLPRFLPMAVSYLLALIIPTGIVYVFHLQVPQVGAIPHSLFAPALPDFSHISDWQSLFMSSLAVFAIASLETLLSSNAVDKITKDKPHKANQELIGQGFANIAVAIFGGIPVTGVIARSSVNISAGAKTRRAGIFHALTLIILVYFTPQLIETIPVAVLAGILLVAGLSMLNFRDLINYWRNDKFDLFIYAVTFLTIISSDLVGGIQAGLILALIIAAIRLLATKSSVQLWSNKSVFRISLSGNMSFWSFETLGEIQDQVLNQAELKFVVFEFEDVQGMDATGARHLTDTAKEINSHGIQVIFHGASEGQQKLLASSVNGNIKPYTITITENDIKVLLEQKGISHLATDVLKHGISKFSGKYAQDHKQLIDTLAQGQNPHTLLITCSDSRLNPNAFFSSNLGELFIVRNVGNVIPEYDAKNKYSEGAAIEFAIGALGIRNVVVCAHTECGAVKASIKYFGENTHSGLDNWLQLIKDGYNNRAPYNADEGTRINLLNQIAHLKTYPIVTKLLASNEITISAWIYDVHSATILEWNEAKQDFVSTINSSAN
jgi:carbonic anhydrase